MTPRRALRVGLIGAGSVAQAAHLPILSASTDVDIVGLVTATEESARRSLQRWPIRQHFDNAKEMISAGRLDALFVLTPRLTHTAFVQLAIDAGVDVFCEKPLASTAREAWRLADSAAQAGVILMVGFNRRYADVYRKAKTEFADARPQFCIAQKNRQGSEYRATFENAIHMIDLLRWFCGEPNEVNAHAIGSDPYEERGLMALIRFESGSVGTLVAARCAGEWDERLDAYGGGTSVRVIAPDAVSVVKKNVATVTEARSESFGWVNASAVLGFHAAVEHFLDCVRNRHEPETNGAEAAKTQAVLESILASAGLPLDDAADGDWVSHAQC